MSFVKELLQQFVMPTYIVEVGIMSIDTKRTDKVQLGLTNAELMFIHENGSPLHNLPARPVLQMTIDWANNSGLTSKTIDKYLDVYLKTNSFEKAEKELSKFCLKLQNYARRIIYDNDGKLEANAPSTIKRKGFNHPLFVTGQLARSITCRYIRL